MSEYIQCVSEKMETGWEESAVERDALTGKFRLKGTSRGHLVQTAAPNKVNFKTLLRVLGLVQTSFENFLFYSLSGI